MHQGELSSLGRVKWTWPHSFNMDMGSANTPGNTLADISGHNCCREMNWVSWGTLVKDVLFSLTWGRAQYLIRETDLNPE